ncbi:MAG: hypothetical protein H7A33_05890 [Deltaproteobacteria bacterium]|nr:hypothetical protein [Deltaproteobacteria bacterium]
MHTLGSILSSFFLQACTASNTDPQGDFNAEISDADIYSLALPDTYILEDGSLPLLDNQDGSFTIPEGKSLDFFGLYLNEDEPPITMTTSGNSSLRLDSRMNDSYDVLEGTWTVDFDYRFCQLKGVEVFFTADFLEPPGFACTGHALASDGYTKLAGAKKISELIEYLKCDHSKNKVIEELQEDAEQEICIEMTLQSKELAEAAEIYLDPEDSGL